MAIDSWKVFDGDSKADAIKGVCTYLYVLIVSLHTVVWDINQLNEFYIREDATLVNSNS